MAIDYSTLDELFGYLRNTLSDIESFEITENILEENKERSAAVKYMMQTAVECCANIAEHIIFGLDLGNPTNTKELFPVLGQHKIIDESLSQKLQKAIGLRNVLVHLYTQVDLGILADSATVGLNDLREFAKKVNKFLEKQRGHDKA